MFSVITCSISSEKADKLKTNIHNTIGDTEYEIIVIDNSQTKWPIAKAYNYGASNAKYPFLLFIHEDVVFLTKGWGKIISDKLKENDCGIIGFAGCTIKSQVYSEWGAHDDKWDRKLYWYKLNGDNKFDFSNVLWDTAFQQVITLDGFAMFVRKEIWQKYPFDEKTLNGFHCYDIDFSLTVSQHYKNYVCSTLDIQVQHLSNGNFNSDWVETSIRMHNGKWKDKLPARIPGLNISPKEEEELNEKLLWTFYKYAYKANYNDLPHIFRRLLSLPMSKEHLNHLISGIWKLFLRKCLRHKYSKPAEI